MSTRSAKEPESEGLSISTLLIASLSSIAAAVFVHHFWSGGAILGAGITPIIVALVSEALKRPTRKLRALREERARRSRVARGTPRGTEVAPPPELERPDPFGIWEADRRAPWWERLKGRPLKIALATGVLAFVIAAIAVTAGQLVFGGGDRDRLIFVPGPQRPSDTGPATTTTEPAETGPAETTPPATQTVPPTTETQPQTVPTTPQTTQTTPSPAQTMPTTPDATPTPAPVPAPGG